MVITVLKVPVAPRTVQIHLLLGGSTQETLAEFQSSLQLELILIVTVHHFELQLVDHFEHATLANDTLAIGTFLFVFLDCCLIDRGFWLNFFILLFYILYESSWSITVSILNLLLCVLQLARQVKAGIKDLRATAQLLG